MSFQQRHLSKFALILILFTFTNLRAVVENTRLFHSLFPFHFWNYHFSHSDSAHNCLSTHTSTTQVHGEWNCHSRFYILLFFSLLFSLLLSQIKDAWVRTQKQVSSEHVICVFPLNSNSFSLFSFLEIRDSQKNDDG